MPLKKQSAGPINVFIVFAEEDRPHKERLEKQLSPYVRSGLMELWDQDQFIAGRVIREEISRHITSSHIILLLVSADFIASEWCYTQMEYAMQQHVSGSAIVIPIYIRRVDWPDAPFKSLFSLPRKGKPVTSWLHSDNAWYEIGKEISDKCEDVRKRGI